MKLSLFTGVLLLVCAVCHGQTPGQATTHLPSDTTYSVMERGANHNVWEKTSYELGPNGKVVPQIHRYVELSSGLNYRDSNNAWTPSKELIEAYPGGSVARNGQYKVIFANNLNSYGAIDMQTTDQKRLRSNILGLMYVDTSTEKAVMIADIQDSTGQVISANQVLYPNAFNGVKADVRYTYRKCGFEQDVILREQPPIPETYGLNSDTTVLEVVTEFINPPPAQVKDADKTDKEQNDEEVDWGATRIGRGKAFDLNKRQNSVLGVPVNKRYIDLQGRHFLLERVRLDQIRSDLNELPLQSSSHMKRPTFASSEPVYPKTPQMRRDKLPMRMALTTPSDQGYVLDYQTINSSLTNYTFQGDTTYYISETLNLEGTNIFEGGTVLKYARNASLYISGGKFAFSTSGYRPSVFTAIDDNTVGETIGGSTGILTGYYANPALNISSMTVTSTIANFRISWANMALSVGSSYLAKVYDGQFVNCGQGIGAGFGSVNVRNALFANVQTNFGFGYDTIDCQNVTFSGSQYIASSMSYGALSLENCILSDVANLTNTVISATLSGNYNGFYNSPVFGMNVITNTFYPFQRVGGGNYYLTNQCSFQNSGTTNIDPKLLADISNKTTSPPFVYSNTTISAAMTFSPRAPRDTNPPDLGYHYDPLDYVFGGVTLTTNLTFNAGTAAGWFQLPGSGGPGYGIQGGNGNTVSFNGTVMSPCVFTRYNTVQEGGNGLWTDKGWLAGITGAGSYDPNQPTRLEANFTRFTHLAGAPGPFRDYYGVLLVRALNSEIYGTYGGYNLMGNFTNCLIYRVNFWQGTGQSAPYEIYRNCTFYGGSFTIVHWESGAPYWYSSIRNCAFDATTISIDDPFGTNSAYADYDYNAFLVNSNQLVTEGTNNVTVSNFSWQTNWLGNYYLPSDSLLIDKGSTTADSLGLFYFTTQTNQVEEEGTKVDIGYHYVSLDLNGQPIDSNHDGIPDYLDAIPLWQAADPDNPAAGILSVTIDSPTNGEVIQ